MDAIWGESPQHRTKTLKLEDCTCTICTAILIEPVVMPCRHELCLPCFKSNVEETSLTCPMCRTRISTWARRAAKTNKLVDRKRWVQIQEAFPQRVKNRLEGKDDDDEEEEEEVYLVPLLSEPGAIRQEYEEQLHRLEAEREEQQRAEEEASRHLIEELQKQEEIQQQQEDSDQAYARHLSQKIQSDATSPDALSKISRHIAKAATPTMLDKFVTKLNRRKPMDGLAESYPYKSVTPSDQDSLTHTPSRPPSRYSDIFRQGDPHDNSGSTTSYIYASSGPASPPSPDIDMLTQMKMEPKADMCDDGVASVPEVPKACPQQPTALGIQQRTARSASANSDDSISAELAHFRPIEASPRTPPRRLPSGRQVEPPVVLSTPRNLRELPLLQPGVGSQLDPHTMMRAPLQRMLYSLAAERQAKVNQLSKGTTTASPVAPLHEESKIGFFTKIKNHLLSSATVSASHQMESYNLEPPLLPHLDFTETLLISSESDSGGQSHTPDSVTSGPTPAPILPLDPNIESNSLDAYDSIFTFVSAHSSLHSQGAKSNTSAGDNTLVDEDLSVSPDSVTERESGLETGAGDAGGGGDGQEIAGGQDQKVPQSVSAKTLETECGEICQAMQAVLKKNSVTTQANTHSEVGALRCNHMKPRSASCDLGPPVKKARLCAEGGKSPLHLRKKGEGMHNKTRSCSWESSHSLQSNEVDDSLLEDKENSMDICLKQDSLEDQGNVIRADGMMGSQEERRPLGGTEKSTGTDAELACKKRGRRQPAPSDAAHSSRTSRSKRPQRGRHKPAPALDNMAGKGLVQTRLSFPVCEDLDSEEEFESTAKLTGGGPPAKLTGGVQPAAPSSSQPTRQTNNMSNQCSGQHRKSVSHRTDPDTLSLVCKPTRGRPRKLRCAPGTHTGSSKGAGMCGDRSQHHIHILAEVDQRLDHSHFPTEAEYQEYVTAQDRLLALKLQEDFNLEAKYHLNGVRNKASENAYALRGSRRTTTVRDPT